MNTTLGSRTVDTNPVRHLVHSPTFILVMMLLLHPPLALAMRASSQVATAHALLTLTVGLGATLFSRDYRKAGYAAAYIAGSEVLWRMTDAGIFWEAGKYFTIFILGVALLRIRPWRRASLPMIYFLLFCLSIPLTVLSLDPSTARGAISFNLSGPLALAVCALYFLQIRLDTTTLRSLTWWLLFPVIGMSAVIISRILAQGQIVFYNDSNFATSGGFGPNQVSAVLGLGAGLLIMLLITSRRLPTRLITFPLALGLTGLSALTFSRGGLYNAAIMLALALIHFLRSGRSRMVALVLLLAGGMVGGYVIFPRLNTYTGGLMEQRFTDLNLSHRGEIARADLDLWLENPLFGVGPGLSTTGRVLLLGYEVAAHTEYTRVLAEHGAAGLLALMIMLAMAIRAYLRAPGRAERMWIAALAGWSLMEMSHAAMRIVAIAFLFGLAMVNWDDSPDAEIQSVKE